MTDLDMLEDREFCTCRVGPLLLGIEVDRVQEVLFQSEYTEVPRTDSHIAGLINLRGQIATAIDLRVKLDVEANEDNEDVHIVVRYRGEPVSLLVDDIGDVITVPQSTFEATPETLTGVAKELIAGAYKLEDSLLLSLDTSQVIATSTGSFQEIAR
ncbi:MAG: chemotaxis protein CheW [Actinomycetota bacterium]